MEFNFYGPRASRLAPYLRRAVGGDCPEFALEALLRQDVATVLSRKRAVRKLDLLVRQPYIDVIAQANASLGLALRAAETASRADCVGVYLEPEPYQRRNLSGGILDTLRQLARRSPCARTRGPSGQRSWTRKTGRRRSTCSGTS
jgi:hypothetical protein